MGAFDHPFNKPRAITAPTRLMGVQEDYGKYRSKITHKRIKVSLGVYDTPEEAHQAFLAAKQAIAEGKPVPRVRRPEPKGTRKVGKKWAALYRGKYLSTHDTEQEARQAYLAAKAAHKPTL